MTHASSRRPPDSAELSRDEIILALQARERLLGAILGSLEVFLAVDAAWRVTFANQAATEMTGRGAEELVGGDVWELMPAELHTSAGDELHRAMTERVSVEYEVPGQDGVTYLGTAYPLDDGGLAIYSRDITESKRRESERDELFAALRQSEQSFQAVFEASPYAMSLTEVPSGTITRVNRAFEALFGFSREELVGKSSPELGISDPASQAEVARRFAEEGVLRDVEVPRTTHAGDQMTLSISLDWVTIDQHKSVLTCIRDVTRRVQSQIELQRSREALLASERRYRSIVEATGDGIMIGHPTGSIAFVNQRMADMLGYERDELVGVHGFDLTYPEWQPAVLDNRVALDEGNVVRGEFMLRRKDGTPIWTMFSSTPMFDTKGAHTGNLTLHSDITGLKAAEEARRQSEQTLRSFYDSAPFLMGVGRLDGDRTVVLSANRAMGEALGMDPDAIAGLRGVDIGNPPEFERALYDACRETERTSRPVCFEQTRDSVGERLVLNVTVSHVGTDPDGAPMFSFIAEDVTERRRTQENLRERQLAAAAQEERSRLARDLHDSVTQALFAASLKAEALTTAGDVAPETASAVEEVRRLTGGALAQMRTMLLELRGEPLDRIPIRQLLHNVVEATESRTQTRLELTIEGEDVLPPALHVAVYRIAQEALNNVARHARAEHAWVELQTGAEQVRLSVSDDGLGFEPGPQGPAHLGLRSMLERAVEAGADLRVESAPGRGTSIIVEWRPPAS